jgi:Ser/Thr protein kinase RdoA (MazF antagonist)
LIPALRAMRQLHHAGWIAARWHDPAFPAAFPFAAEPRWWEQHIADLHELAEDL